MAAASGRSITVEFLGNSRGLTNSMDQAESRSKRFGKSIGAAGKVLAGGLAVGAIGAAAGLVKLTQGAIEDEAAQKRLAQTYRKNAQATDAQIKATEDWISAQGTALGITDDELRPALGKLVTATKDVGEAQKLAALAMDISKARGMDLETVATALAKAQNGQVGGLKKLGIQTQDSVKDSAALEAANIAVHKAQDDYNSALAEFGPSSTEAARAAEKLEYRQTKVGEAQAKTKKTTIDFTEAQERLTKAYGGAAQDAANTTAGKMQRLKVIMAETGETIGAKLIPVVTKMADWFLNKGLPAIQQFSSYLQVKVPPIFEMIKTKVIAAFNQIKGPAKETFATIKGVVIDFVSIVQSLWKRFGDDIMQYTRSAFTNAKTIISGIFKVIRGIFKTVSALLKGDWKGVWDGIKTIVRGAGQALVGIFKQVGNLLRFAWKTTWNALKAVVSGVWTGIKDSVRKGFNDVISYVTGVPARIANKAYMFVNAGKDLMKGLLRGIGTVGDFAKDFAGDLWKAVKGAINDGIDDLNDKLEFDFKVKGVGFTVNAPNIPHLAKGGVVRARRGGTLALLGEAGADEAVVPLSGPHAPRMSGMSGGTVNNFYISGAIDPVGTAKQIEKILIIAQRSMTGPYQFQTR